ncbi:MAG: D-alanyl-D-alanine carboxypeptidase family protein [Bacillaceae bacterium]
MVLGTFLFSTNLVYASEVKVAPKLAPSANSAIVIEQDTGKVLYEKNANQKLPPASMTKIVTMLLIMEQIKTGKLKYTDKIRASEYAASMGGSQIFLEPGEEMTVNEMLKGIAIASGNDASVAMAERIAGSEDAFVQMMNNKVKELGLKDSQFQNPTGLPEKEHYSTSHDMAMLGRELLKYPEITKYTGTYEDYLRENTEKRFWLVNTNKLVRFYPGVDGLKTGFTAEAKYCLTATAKKEGMRVIAVVMGEPTSKDRNKEVGELLDYAFSQYMVKRIYDQNKAVANVDVSKGKKEKVKAMTKEPVSLLMAKGEAAKKLKKEINVVKEVKAPLKKGAKLGEIVVKDGNKVVAKVDLISNETIKEASFWELFKRTFNFFSKGNE